MKKTWLVLVNEIRVTLRRKTFMIIGFGVPLVLAIIALVMGVVNREATADLASNIEQNLREQKAQGYVDEGGLIETLPDNIPADMFVSFPDDETARQALESGEIDGYFIIPGDYVTTGELTYVKASHNFIEGGSQSQTVEWALLVNLLQGDQELAGSVWRPLDLELTQLTSDEGPTAEESWIAEMLPTFMALILYMVIIIAAGVLVQAVTDEKKNKVIEVMLSSVSTTQMITGKILGVAILGLLILLAWGSLLYGVANFGGQSLNIPAGYSIPGELIFWACVYALFGYLMYGSLMAGLGALAPDVKDTRSASFIVLSPFILTYMFLIFIAESPNGPIAIVLSLFPLTSPIAMISRMTVTTVPVWQSALAALLQLIGAFIIIRMVARLFRAQSLLSGQPFEVKRYFNALLGRA